MEKRSSDSTGPLFSGSPWALFRKGLHRLPFDPSASRLFFETAFHQFQNNHDSSGLFLSWAAIVETIGYGFEDLSRLEHWIGIMETLIRDSVDFPSKSVEARVASAMFSALVLRRTSHEELKAWEKRAISLAIRHGDVHVKIQTSIHKVILEMLSGDFDNAGKTTSTLEQLVQAENIAPLDRILTGFTTSFYYQFIGLNKACDEIISKAMALSRKSGILIMEVRLLSRMASIALDMNDYASAEKLARQMKQHLAAEKVWESFWFHFTMSRYSMLRGEIRQAAFHIRRALSLSNDVGFAFLTGICHLLKMRIIHRLGDSLKADSHFTCAFTIAEKSQSTLLKYYCEMTKAVAELDLKHEKSAMQSFQNALSIGKNMEYLNTFLDHPGETASLCVKALNSGIEIQYVQDMIRTRNLIPDIPPHDVEDWPWPIKIFTLGRFSLVSDGKPIRFTRKGRQKPLAMLKVLIALGGREIKAERIADILWPDTDGDVAHQSFNTTLHRLRRLLGNPDCFRLRNNRLSLDQHLCWVDVWAFERIIGQIDSSGHSPVCTDKSTGWIKKLQYAVNLYNGCFLSGEEDEPWSVFLRERLKSKFQRALGRLANYYKETKQWEKEIESLQRNLEIDHLAEENYQRLMYCYRRIGRPAEALSVYERCKNIFTLTYGIKPSPETETIRQSLFTENWN
jgi:DNA-binding SARP family transcriptional activator